MTNETYFDFLIYRLERVENDFASFLDGDGKETLGEAIIALKHMSIISKKKKAIERAIKELESHNEQ